MTRLLKRNPLAGQVADTPLGHRLRVSGIFLAVFLMASGIDCSSVPENHYFTMAYVLLPGNAGERPAYQQTVRVRQLEIGPAYDTERIVYRYSPYEFQYYNFMRWAAKPHVMLTNLIVRHLQHAQLFGDVAMEYHDRVPDYEISGVVYAVEELDSGNEWFAHLAFSLRLSRYRGEKVVWSHEVDVKKQVYNKEPVYVVRALSELMEAEMQKISVSLEKFLAAQSGTGRSADSISRHSGEE